MTELTVIIDGEVHKLERDVDMIYCHKDCTEYCSLAEICTGENIPCQAFGVVDTVFRHFEKQENAPEPKKCNLKYSMEVDGKRHVLVQDPQGNIGYLSCKACSLREQCKVGELLCIEILGDSRRDRYSYHFEQIDLPNVVEAETVKKSEGQNAGVFP